MGTFIDITGRRFGRLLVLRRNGTASNGEPKWDCTCDCGGTASPTGYTLRKGIAASCGCLHREKFSASTTTHGMSKTPTYSTWCNMRRRCGDPTHMRYEHYGGRGISVCERWQSSFANFLADMGERPGPGFSIERHDMDGNYEPGNCCWATAMDQAKNKRNNRRLTFGGRTETITEWGRITGLGTLRIWNRVNKLGWPAARALTEPVNTNKIGNPTGRH